MKRTLGFLDVLKFLMEQHDLLQKDLTDIFGKSSDEWQERIEQGAHQATRWAIPRFTRTFFLT